MESNEGGEGVQTTSTSKIPRKEAFQSLLTDKARKSTSNIRVDNKSSIDKSTNKTKDKNGMLGRNTGKVLKSIRLSNKHIDSSISTIPRSLPKSVINTIDVQQFQRRKRIQCERMLQKKSNRCNEEDNKIVVKHIGDQIYGQGQIQGQTIKNVVDVGSTYQHLQGQLTFNPLSDKLQGNGKLVKTRSKIKQGPQLQTILTSRCQSRWRYGSGHVPAHALVFATWNVNGIRAVINRNNLNQFIKSYNPDILCLNETKINQLAYDISPIELPGYSAYWNFPKSSSGYSGVAIFTKYLPISLSQDFLQTMQDAMTINKDLNIQGRMLTIHYKQFILISVYTPMSGKQLQRLSYRLTRYDPSFLTHILTLQQRYPNKMIIIAGDLNVAHSTLDCHGGKDIENYTPSVTPGQRKGLTMLMMETKMKDVWREMHIGEKQFTWWYSRCGGGKAERSNSGVGRRLDYFLVEEKWVHRVKECKVVVEARGSDHCPVVMVMQVGEEVKEGQNMKDKEQNKQMEEKDEKLMINKELTIDDNMKGKIKQVANEHPVKTVTDITHIDK